MIKLNEILSAIKPHVLGWFDPPLVDYSATSSVAGWSSFTVKQIYYRRLGHLVFVQFYIQGTSSGPGATFTLPVNTAAAPSSITFWVRVADNGAYPGAPGIGTINASSGTVAIYKDQAAGSFTTSGLKEVSGEFFYYSA